MASLWYRVEPDTETSTSTTRMISALRASGIGTSHRRALGFDEIAEVIADGFPIVVVAKAVRPDISTGSSSLRTVFVAGNKRLFFGRNEYRRGQFRRIWARRGSGSCAGESRRAPAWR